MPGLIGLFPKIMSQFKAGNLITARFVVSAGPVYTRKSLVPTQDFQGLSMVDAGTGLVTVTLLGGSKRASLIQARHVSQDATVGTVRKVELYSYNDSTGAYSLKLVNTAATEAIAAAANGDEIHLSFYFDK